MNYPEQDNLVPLTELAVDLGFTPKKKDFDPKSYIPIELLPVKKLFTDPEFQRLLNENMIRSAGEYDPDLVRPLYVFLRPNGKYSTADGQHEGVIGILYTTQGGELLVPCQVRKHPKDFTLQQCLDVEANFFKKLNFNRTNVGVIQRLRADIALKNDDALKIQDDLNDMGVSIEGIGDPDGVPTTGYSKLMDAHQDYGLGAVTKAIDLYQKHQQDPEAPNWNGVEKPLVGGLIGGLAALYHLLPFLGNGDKNYALNYYLENNLRKDKPLGKKSLMSDIGGDLQSVLFARRVVSSCNTLVRQGYITKKNGKPLQVDIEETIMTKAGLGDPSK
tara:strand:- start:129 stop:1121 length:993 start_codon:yes stop_codon:yes gene_type:complete